MGRQDSSRMVAHPEVTNSGPARHPTLGG